MTQLVVEQLPGRFALERGGCRAIPGELMQVDEDAAHETAQQCQSDVFTLALECRWKSTLRTDCVPMHSVEGQGRESAAARDLHIGVAKLVRSVGASST